jgi:hypothetical protein
MILLLTAHVSTRGNPTFFIIILLLLGFFLFYQGFRSYREFRIMEDTPIIPIRSIAMGLSHVRGKPTCDDHLISPLTGLPCFYYWVKVEKYAQSGKHKGWVPVSNEMDRHPFYLDDGNSQILVNPLMAEFEVLPTFSHEIGPSSSRNRFVEPSLGVEGPSEQDLRTYLTERISRSTTQNGTGSIPAPSAANSSGADYKLSFPGIYIGSKLSIDFGAQRYRFSEQCLLAGRDCIVMGTCVENPRPQDEHDRNLITRGSNEATFLISSMTEEKTEKYLRKNALIQILVGALFIIIAVAIALNNSGLL